MQTSVLSNFSKWGRRLALFQVRDAMRREHAVVDVEQAHIHPRNHLHGRRGDGPAGCRSDSVQACSILPRIIKLLK